MIFVQTRLLDRLEFFQRFVAQWIYDRYSELGLLGDKGHHLWSSVPGELNLVQ